MAKIEFELKCYLTLLKKIILNNVLKIKIITTLNLGIFKMYEPS